MMTYSKLVEEAKNCSDPNHEIHYLLELRNLLICALSMKFNKDYPKIIKLLTNVEVGISDIKQLCEKLHTEYNVKEKIIHNKNKILSALL